MFLPSPAMIAERIGIMGSTHGVNVSSMPRKRKPASTSTKLPSNRRAMSISLANMDRRGRASTSRGPSDTAGAAPVGAATSCKEACDSIGT
jgi:hypothetical protein